MDTSTPAAPRSAFLDPRARRVVILANPKAGKWNPRTLVRELEGSLRRRKLDPLTCWHRREFADEVGRVPREDLRCVVAAGGDGTLAEVLFRAPGLPVALLPVGNENLMARHWGVQPSGARVARMINDGCVRQLDVARLEDRHFCLMASAGFDARVVERVHRRRQRHVSHLSYLAPICETIWDYPFPVIEAETDQGECLRGALAFVFNLPTYAVGLRPAPAATADDGLLDLCVFAKPGVVNLVGYLWAVLRGTHEHRADFQHRRVRTVHLRADGKVPLQADGDPHGHLPARIDVVPGGLRLVVPSG